MTDTIHCKKLGVTQTKLPYQPLPGKLGAYIHDNISQEAWSAWLIQQTKIINEYRLNPMETKAQQLLKEEMLTFLFGSKEINELD